MAVVTMTDRKTFEANFGSEDFWIDPFFQGSEAGLIRHSPACAHYKAETGGQEIGPGYADCINYGDTRRETIVDVVTGIYGTGLGGKTGYIAGTCHGPFEPLYMERRFVGLVLDEGEVNGYDDSDFYALVWNEEKGMPVKFTYASTRGWTYPNSCVVDATPEVRAKYEAWRQAKTEEAVAYRARVEEQTVAKGKRVVVFKGRKVAQGTKGEVFWIGNSGYGMRVGIRDAKGQVHWTAATNVRVDL